MQPLAPATIVLHRFGREREPVVQIDGFSGQVGALLAAGRAADYGPAGAHYPGLRAPADPSYLHARTTELTAAMRRVFGFAGDWGRASSAFSLVTVPEPELSAGQRIPHHDSSDAQIIAVMHYLLGPESGGTAFYRHRRSGFEAITPEREAAYRAALAEDGREHGPAPPGYHYGTDERYELIGEIAAAPDRLILYRGRLLHSGVIPDAAKLSADPAKGRLTINMFLEGR